MNWFNIFKPEKKLKPMKLTKWEELYYAVVPAKDVQTITIEAVCSEPTLIGLCEGWVFYLEDGHNAAANALFSKYYEDIVKRFKQEGHQGVADNYIVQGERGGSRAITLDEELIELGEWGR